MNAFENIASFIPESEIVGSPCRYREVEVNAQGWKWEPVEWSQIVRNGDGDIIFTSPRCKSVVKMLAEALGLPFFSVYFVDGRGNYPAQVAFGLPLGVTLDAMDVSAVAMAAWTNSRYCPGIKRTDAPSFPQDLNEYAEASDSLAGLDNVFYSLDDANRMAAIISTLYEYSRPRVIRDGDKWGVVVNDSHFLDSARALELRGIHKLLSKYDVTPLARTNGGSAPKFADRITEQAAFETRIEDGINAILAHLGQPAAQDVADSIATGAELVENIEARARRNRPAKAAGRKSSAKRSA